MSSTTLLSLNKDVYKRQSTTHLHCIFHISPMECCYMPVSYTHLDVYKRQISNNANKPIYEQITTQIKAMIMSGELQAGDAIPSMRSLAKSIHVSVITGSGP